MIIDGKNAVLGRLASYTAKNLIKGEEVTIINAEKIIVTGNYNAIAKKYIERKQRGSPQHGPFFPTKPDSIVRRTVRGMLPKTKKGREALKKLRVEIGNSENKKGETVAVKKIKTNYSNLERISQTLGWKK